MPPVKLAILTSAALLVSGIAGCGGGDRETGVQKSLSGSLSIVAADRSLPFVQAGADQFQTENPSVTIDVTEGGPRSAFAQLCAGAIDTVAAARAPRQRERCDGTARSATSVRLPAAGVPVVVTTIGRGAAPEELWAFLDFIEANEAGIASAAAGAR